MQVLYEDPDEEDRESKAIEDVNSTVIKTSGYQQIEELPIEEHIEKPVSNSVDNGNNFSKKCTETSRSTTVITFIFQKYSYTCYYKNKFLKSPFSS